MSDPSGEADRFIRRYLESPGCLLNHPKRTLDNKSRVQRPLWPNEPILKANQLYVPSGATRWSKFIGLASEDAKNQILSIVGGTYPYFIPAQGTLVLSPLVNSPPVTISSGNAIDGSFSPMSPINTVMYLLPPVPVSNVANTLWIIPLVDARYWNCQTSLVWNPTVLTGGATWNGLITSLANVMGMNIPADTVAVNRLYGVPDACFFRNGMIDAAAALDMACWSTGQRFVCKNAGETNPDKKYILRSSATAPSLYITQSTALTTSGTTAGGNWSATDNGDVPSILEFHFTNDGPSEALNYPQPAVNVPSWADGLARDFMCTASTSLGDATVKAMADQWCMDWWQWTQYRFQWSLPGIIDWHFSGYEDFVLYDMSRRQKGDYNCRTLVRSIPPSWGWDVVPFQISGVTRACGSGGGPDMVFFRLENIDCVNRIATGTAQFAALGCQLPEGPQEIRDDYGCILVGNPLLLEGNYAWCVKCEDDNPYDYLQGTYYSIVFMCGLGSNC